MHTKGLAMHRLGLTMQLMGLANHILRLAVHTIGLLITPDSADGAHGMTSDGQDGTGGTSGRNGGHIIGLEMYMIGTAVCFIGLTVHTKGPRAKNKLASRTMGPAVHMMVLGGA